MSEQLKPPGKIKFLADVMLGKLARYLLITGHDCLYQKDFADSELVQVARRENRVVLSRDRDLVREKINQPPAQLIEATGLRELLSGVKEKFHLLFSSEHLFTRCLECNEQVIEIRREEARGHVPAETFSWLDNYYRCPECKQVFWRGSHYEAVKNRLKEWNLLDE